MSNNYFNSPTYGKLTLDQVRKRIVAYMGEDPQSEYRLVIGTDSQPKESSGADFVTAIVVHRIGWGGIYFWRRTVIDKPLVMRSRIYQEATLSLETAEELLEVYKKNGIAKYDVEIHVDIGAIGPTREMIAEVVGMVRGSGYAVKTKPDAYGASKVADRHA